MRCNEMGTAWRCVVVKPCGGLFRCDTSHQRIVYGGRQYGDRQWFRTACLHDHVPAVDPRDLDEVFQLLTRLIDGQFARSRPAVPDTANWMPNAA